MLGLTLSELSNVDDLRESELKQKLTKCFYLLLIQHGIKKCLLGTSYCFDSAIQDEC